MDEVLGCFLDEAREQLAQLTTTSAGALGELANVAGGNLEALLPPVCHLSLPRVVRSGDRPGGDVLADAYECEDGFLVVSVHPAETDPH